MTGSRCGTPNDFKRKFNNGNGKMSPIIDESCDIILRHLWQLLLEDTFQSCQDDHALASIVIVDYTEFDYSGAFFKDSWLC